ncbi:hypothetical protein IWQ60_011024, partial [Tieghemiomyces parasiticus]
MLQASHRVEANVVLVGCGGIGKSSLIYRYANGRLDSKAVPSGLDITTKDLNTSPCRVVLRVWDINGVNQPGNKTRLNDKNAFAAVLCYDLTDIRTLFHVVNWIEEIRSTTPDCVLYLCGLRNDRVARKDDDDPPADSPTQTTSSTSVSPNELHHYHRWALTRHHRPGYFSALREFCLKYDVSGVYETSAVTGANVQALFTEIVSEWIARYSDQ